MPFVISATASLFAYLVVMRLLFEDFDELMTTVQSTVAAFPISVVLDHAFGNDSLRAWVWMVSGPLAGVFVYAVISQ